MTYGRQESRALPTLVAALAIAWAFFSQIHASAADAPKEKEILRATISFNRKTADIGENVFTDFAVENLSSSDINLPLNFFNFAPRGKTGLFISVTDKSGAVFENKCPASPRSEIDIPLILRPGEFHGAKKVNLVECFSLNAPGEYSVRGIFSSADEAGWLWEGTLKTEASTLAIKGTQTVIEKKSQDLKEFIDTWIKEYDLATAAAYRARIIEFGRGATPDVAAILKTTDNYSLASDLVEILSALPCRESGDALVDFLKISGGKNFKTNVPEGFSAGKVLSGETLFALERMTGEDLRLFRKMHPDLDNDALWEMWWKENRDTFPPAFKGQGNKSGK